MAQFEEDREDRPLAETRILLAEDEERLRTIMSMMIEELGADVTSVASGKAALDIYKVDGEKFDLVVLDMRMEGLSGEGTFRKLLELNPDVKVVLSSGIWPDDHIVDLLFANKGGFIEKPFNLERLALVLATVLSGEPMVRKL